VLIHRGKPVAVAPMEWRTAHVSKRYWRDLLRHEVVGEMTRAGARWNARERRWEVTVTDDRDRYDANDAFRRLHPETKVEFFDDEPAHQAR
jgi:hypothetical protein